MLKNNIELDIKTKCIEEDKTQAWIAKKVGTSPAYIRGLTIAKRISLTKHSFP